MQFGAGNKWPKGCYFGLTGPWLFGKIAKRQNGCSSSPSGKALKLSKVALTDLKISQKQRLTGGRRFGKIDKPSKNGAGKAADERSFRGQ